MSYTPYYAPYARPMGYYNPSIPQENQNIQVGQQFNPQMQHMMQTPTPMISNDMLWVLNETEATSYPVAPNNRVILWDKNQDTVYIKSVDAQGVPSIQILDYVERTPQTAQKRTQEEHKCTCGDRFIPKEKFDELEAKFDELRAKVENLEKPKIMPKNKKVEENNDGE